ncbi:MAG: Mut7-C ubiquitin/RNAse domain-containing protein [Chlorobi bacterium]|nr:Mut7-C ubiquitin/RNAse domain-containing protein [Chlorobiota bacterium]
MASDFAYIRFYAELNDMLSSVKRKELVHRFDFYGKNTVKDAIQSFNIPHTQVDLIIVNGKSVSFDYYLMPGDNVSVYPVFESIDITPVTRLRPKPLRRPAFILDVHLGKLARMMRMAGFDTLYRNDFDDDEIMEISVNELRIILTRDIGILKHNSVTHGYWLHNTDPDKQFREIIRRFDLKNEIDMFTRCLRCNGKLEKIEKNEVLDKLPECVQKNFSEFWQCSSCHKVYWKGSHYDRMKDKLKKLLD